MSALAAFGLILTAMIVLLASGLVPAPVVVIGAVLALWASGILDLPTALGGFGDSTVLFIGSLLVVSASLDRTGVTAWASQVLLRRAGRSSRRLVIYTMLACAGLSALVGPGAAVAALLPMTVLLGVRVGRAPSELLMPLAFASHTGGLLLLTGSLSALLASDALEYAGNAPLGYFEPGLVGVPLVLGAIAITAVFGPRLVPRRVGRAVPADLSKHPRTLGEQYGVFNGLFALDLLPGSPLERTLLSRFALPPESGLELVAVQDRVSGGPLRRRWLEPGDTLLVRGESAAVRRFAARSGLTPPNEGDQAAVERRIFNAVSGLAEVVVPPRSALVGQAVFPGMVTESGDFVILALQRRGRDAGRGEAVIEAGDTLLLQGSWAALDRLQNDPDVLVVDRPQAVRSQAIPMGAGARRALAVLGTMVFLLATGLVPAVVAALSAASALIILRVLTIDDAYRSINWTVLIMIAGLLPLAPAMSHTGADALIADALIARYGEGSPLLLQGALFGITALLTQVISSAAAALIVMPVALAASAALEISPRPLMMGVCLAASACYLTPISSGANLMAQGPAGYRFFDFARLGLPLMLWSLLLAVAFVPLVWRF